MLAFADCCLQECNDLADLKFNFLVHKQEGCLGDGCEVCTAALQMPWAQQSCDDALFDELFGPEPAIEAQLDEPDDQPPAEEQKTVGEGQPIEPAPGDEDEPHMQNAVNEEQPGEAVPGDNEPSEIQSEVGEAIVAIAESPAAEENGARHRYAHARGLQIQG